MKKNFALSLIFFTLLVPTTYAQRRVLIEQFTNSGCPPCAANTPVIASYVNNNPSQVLMLSYHTSYPYLDSMYYENAFQSNQRVSFYNVGAVPYSVVDGNYYNGSSAPLVSILSTSIGNRAAVSPRYNINFVSVTLNANTVNVTLAFESINASNQNETLSARVVVAEKNVLKSAYLSSPGNNSETQYPWVVRRMLPDENGTNLYNKSLGGMDTIILTWNANNFKDLNEMRVVAFVQNAATNEIYQSEIGTPINVTGISTIENESGFHFSLEPTLATTYFKIKLSSQASASVIKIYNVIRKLVSESIVEKGVLERQFSTSNFRNGIYFVTVNANGKTETRKLVINK